MARIALVTSSYTPRVGGVEEHVRHVAAELDRSGHEVVVWTVDQGDDVPERVDGIRVRALPCPLPARDASSLARFAWRVPRAVAAWEHARRSDRPDILHVHCYGPNGTYATALAAAHGLPLIYSHHGETFADAHRVFDTSALMRRSIRWTLSRADAVTSCSRFAAGDLGRFGLGMDRIAVVVNGVDLDEPVGPVPAWLPQRFVTGVGRLVSVKGFDLLIEAFATVADQVPDVDLVIGGDGPEKAALADLAGRLGIADRVHLPGMLERDQVGAVMGRAQIVVVPSRAEAFGITVLEGWRAGTAVVATRFGGPGSFVDDGTTGVLIDPQDTAGFGAAMRDLLTDDQARDRIAAAGRREVEGFTWPRVAGEYERLYARILHRRR